MIRDPWLERARRILAELDVGIAGGKTHLLDARSDVARMIAAAEVVDDVRASIRRQRQLARYDREIDAARARGWWRTARGLERERAELAGP